MFKTSLCTLRENTDGTDTTILEIDQSSYAWQSPKYPFGSRLFGDTSSKIDDVLNGKYYRLPFGIRIVKT
jgi:hypothetical protein